MFMNKKKLFALSLVVIMVAILSFSSLAWFSDADKVTNNFGIAGSDDKKPDEVFSVDVLEYVEDTNGDGVVNDQDAPDTDGYKYEDILPGGHYNKFVNIKNTGAYDQFIRVTVTLSDANAWVQMLRNHGFDPATFDLTAFFLNHPEQNWKREVAEYDPAANNGEGTFKYVYYYVEDDAILEPQEQILFFERIRIPFWLNQNDLALVGGSFDLDILAEAIQTEYLGDNVVDAFKHVEADQDIDQIPNP